MSRNHIGLVVLALVLAGCPPEVATDAGLTPVDAGAQADGGSGATDSGVGVSLEPLKAWCTRMAAIETEVGRACGLFAPTFASDSNPFEKCLAAQSLLDAGVLEFNAVAAQQCIDELLSTCRFAAQVPSCREALGGAKPEGAACSSVECNAQTYCDFSGSVCPGTCRGRVDAGVVPPSHEACPVGTYSTGPWPCEGPRPLGASCRGTNTSGPFPQYLPCARGTYCAALSGRWSCDAFVDAGARCMGSEECGAGNQCSAEAGGLATCMPLRRFGEKCAIDSPEHLGAPSPRCQHGLACSDGGVCIAAHGVDGACEGDDDCGTGLRCQIERGGGGRCVARVAIGGNCTSPDQCVAGAGCTGSCVVLPTFGQACSLAVGCLAPYQCGGDAGCVLADYPCAR